MLGPCRFPLGESRCVGESQRARSDREEREQRTRVGTGPAEANGDQAAGIDLRSIASGESLQPEGRPAGLRREHTCGLVACSGGNRLRQCERLIVRQPPQLELTNTLGCQEVGERV